jgi:hypothetical protein
VHPPAIALTNTPRELVDLIRLRSRCERGGVGVDRVASLRVLEVLKVDAQGGVEGAQRKTEPLNLAPCYGRVRVICSVLNTEVREMRATRKRDTRQ